MKLIAVNSGKECLGEADSVVHLVLRVADLFRGMVRFKPQESET